MYVTLSYDITAGKEPIEDVQAEMNALLKAKKRLRCDVLSDTCLCSVVDSEDYLTLATALGQIGKDFSGQFQYFITLHEAGDPFRSNGKFPREEAKAIIGRKGDDD